MKISEKIPAAERAIRFITRHHDEDSQVRLAVIENLKALLDAEKVEIEAEVQAAIDAQLGGGE